MDTVLYGEKELADLRGSLAGTMSEKRYRHTLEVEKMAARIGEIYLPEKVTELRAAGLLHDITKEKTLDEQVAICTSFGFPVSERDRRSPKIFHAITASLLLPTLYPAFASEDVIAAVRWHTTGKAGMTRMEQILYLADYIDLSRVFPECVALREMFWTPDFSAMTEEEKTAHLRRVLIASYDVTIRGLLDDGKTIHEDTLRARNALIEETYLPDTGK